MAVERRPANPTEDYDFARSVHHAAYRDVVERQFGPWDEQDQDRFFGADWGGAVFEILLWAGRPCGYVAVESRAEDVHVRELVVDPNFQGLGIGTEVLRDAMRLAEDRDVPVLLGTFLRSRALDLYS